MAITQADLAPFINTKASSYPYLSLGDYNAGNYTKSSGGYSGGSGFKNSIMPFTSGNGLIDANIGMGASMIDPIGGLAFGLGGLLGGNEEPTWNPYSQNGLYYWADPTKRNPVPNATVSGASLSPSSSYRKLANNTQALYDLMPYMSQAVNQTAVPTALSQLAASQATSPGYAQLMTEMYNTYGPQLNAIGNEILGRNMQAEAKNQLATIQGPGTDLVNEAYKLSQIYDKPYYDSRQKASDALSNLIGSIDVTGGLSETERNEIQQGLNRTNIQRGTLNSPSQTDVIADAMRYGQAGTNRKVQQQGLLSQAIQNASSFLPTAKSGVDVFQVATGKSSTSNPGNSLFTGVNKDSNSGAYGLAGNLFNSGTALDTTQMNIDANKKDWLDQFNQFASGLGSIMGSAKGMLAA